MTDFKAMETFMWVVTLGSFRGAAQKLNTTQPAISQRIAQLEREIGGELLQRDRRMVLPTQDHKDDRRNGDKGEHAYTAQGGHIAPQR